MTHCLHTKPFTEAIPSLLKMFPYCSWRVFEVKDLYDLSFIVLKQNSQVFMGAAITFFNHIDNIVSSKLKSSKFCIGRSYWLSPIDKFAYFTPIFWWVFPRVISSRRNQPWVSDDASFSRNGIPVMLSYILSCTKFN